MDRTIARFTFAIVALAIAAFIAIFMLELFIAPAVGCNCCSSCSCHQNIKLEIKNNGIEMKGVN